MNHARIHSDWRRGVEATGQWYEPHPWPEEDAIRLPFVGELDAALEALKRIYPPEAARRIFREQPAIAQLLTDHQLADKSPLLYYGLDLAAAAAHVEPWRNGDLVAKLQADEQFIGPRFEVKLMAGFTRGGVQWEHEPLRERGGANPDFRISTGERGVIVDAKAARISEPIKELEKWYRSLAFFGDPPSADVLPAEYEVSDDIAALSSEEKRTLLDEVHGCVRRLHAANAFPATEVVRDIVTVTVSSPPRWTLKHGFDTKAEARRIVRGLVQDGARQIPEGSEGAVIVDVGRYGSLADSMGELQRWMREDDGAPYQQLKYCFFSGSGFNKRKWMYCVLPVGRERLPPDVIETVNRLVRGLNYYACRLESYTDDDLPLLDRDGNFPGAED